MSHDNTTYWSVLLYYLYYQIICSDSLKSRSKATPSWMLRVFRLVHIFRCFYISTNFVSEHTFTFQKCWILILLLTSMAYDINSKMREMPCPWKDATHYHLRKLLIVPNKKWRHTIKMNNHRPVYILPLANYNVYWPIIGHLYYMT